jgi:hypothetical protein
MHYSDVWPSLPGKRARPVYSFLQAFSFSVRQRGRPALLLRSWPCYKKGQPTEPNHLCRVSSGKALPYLALRACLGYLEYKK